MVFMEDQTIEDFKKGTVPRDASREEKEHEGESFTPTRMEEKDKDDFPAIPPRDDDGEDEVIDDAGVDDVDVDDGEHDQVSHNQGEPTNVRKSTWIPVLSIRYPLSKYV